MPNLDDILGGSGSSSGGLDKSLGAGKPAASPTGGNLDTLLGGSGSGGGNLDSVLGGSSTPAKKSGGGGFLHGLAHVAGQVANFVNPVKISQGLYHLGQEGVGEAVAPVAIAARAAGVSPNTFGIKGNAGADAILGNAAGQQGLHVFSQEAPAITGAATHLAKTAAGSVQLPVSALESVADRSMSPLQNSILGQRVQQEGVLPSILSTAGDAAIISGGAGSALDAAGAGKLAEAGRLSDLANATKFAPEGGYESATQAADMAQNAADAGQATEAGEHAAAAQNLSKAADLQGQVAEQGPVMQKLNQVRQGLNTVEHMGNQVVGAPTELLAKGIPAVTRLVPGLNDAAAAAKEAVGNSSLVQGIKDKAAVRSLAKEGAGETQRLTQPVRVAFTQAAKALPDAEDQIATQLVRRGDVNPLTVPALDQMSDAELQDRIDASGVKATPAAIRTAVEYVKNPDARPDMAQAIQHLDAAQAPADLRLANGVGSSQILGDGGLAEARAKVAGEASPAGIAAIQDRIRQGPLAKVEAEADALRQRNLEAQPGDLTPAGQKQVAADAATVKSIRRFVEREEARTGRTTTAADQAATRVITGDQNRIANIAGGARESLASAAEAKLTDLQQKVVAGRKVSDSVLQRAADDAQAKRAAATQAAEEGAGKFPAPKAPAPVSPPAPSFRQPGAAAPAPQAERGNIDLSQQLGESLHPGHIPQEGDLAYTAQKAQEFLRDGGEELRQANVPEGLIRRVEQEAHDVLAVRDAVVSGQAGSATLEDVKAAADRADRLFHAPNLNWDGIHSEFLDSLYNMYDYMQREAEQAPAAEAERPSLAAAAPKELSPGPKAEPAPAEARPGTPKSKSLSEIQQQTNRRAAVANARTTGEAAATDRLTAGEAGRQASAESSARGALAKAQEAAQARLERLTNEASARAFRNDSSRLETLAERRDALESKIAAAPNELKVQAPQVRTALQSAAALAGTDLTPEDLANAGVNPTFVPGREVPEKPVAGQGAKPRVASVKKLGSERMRTGIGGPLDLESQQKLYEQNIAGQVRNETNRRLLTDPRISTPAAAHLGADEAGLTGSDLAQALVDKDRIPVGLVRKNGVDTVDQLPDDQVTHDTPTMSAKAFNTYKDTFAPGKQGPVAGALRTVENAGRITKLLGPGFVLHKGITDLILDKIAGGVGPVELAKQIPEAYRQTKEGTLPGNIGTLEKPNMENANVVDRALGKVAEKGMVGFRTLDSTNRGALYGALRDQGLSPLQAQDRVQAVAGNIKDVNAQTSGLRHIITYPGWQIHLAKVLASIPVEHLSGLLQSGAVASAAQASYDKAHPNQKPTTGGLDDAVNPFGSLLGLGKGLPGESFVQNLAGRAGSMVAPALEYGMNLVGADPRHGGGIQLPGQGVTQKAAGQQLVGLNPERLLLHTFAPQVSQVEDVAHGAKGPAGYIPYRYTNDQPEVSGGQVSAKPGTTKLGAIANLLGVPHATPVKPKKK